MVAGFHCEFVACKWQLRVPLYTMSLCAHGLYLYITSAWMARWLVGHDARSLECTGKVRGMYRKGPRNVQERSEAFGAFRAVPMQEYTKGPRCGEHGVKNVFKNGTVFESKFFAEDIKAVSEDKKFFSEDIKAAATSSAHREMKAHPNPVLQTFQDVSPSKKT